MLCYTVCMEEKDGTERGMLGMTKVAILVAVVAVAGFVGGVLLSSDKGSSVFANVPLLGNALDATPDSSADLGDFWKAWNVLNSQFVQTHGTSSNPSAEERVWGAIQGMTSSFGDPYTVFLPPEDAKIFIEDIAGNFVGVGMEIAIQNDVLTVIAPLKNTPAERAGILTGDKILAINGASTDGLSTDEAVKLIRGEKGTEVTFTIYREEDGEASDISVIRDTIETPVLEHSLNAEAGVYSISIYSFSANSASLFNRALADFRKTGVKKLIIDVRGDPGGYLEAAVAIASNFLDKNEAIVTEDYDGKRENIVHRSRGTGGVPAGTKVVVLMNKGSASASEILAGALQDAGKATLIGTKSFGKGSVQELVDIGKASLKVTVARWLTPSGRSISDGGLTPDIEVERTREDVEAGKDPQLERAIQFLNTGA